MRPLVTMLIRSGIAFGEFAEVAKTVYVEIASSEFALGDRKVSGSRIAILTGLTRKDVRRIVDLLSGGYLDTTSDSVSNMNRATRVLSGWYQDPHFTGPYSVPLELAFDGDISFSALVRKYSGDMPARAMLEELVRVNAVEELKEGEGLRYRPLTRTYIATPLKPDEAQYLGEVLHDLAATIEHNLNPSRTGPKRFERWVGTDKLDKEALQSFRVIVREQGQRFLETLDNWQTLNEVPDPEGRPGAVRTRVGVFMYEEFLEGETSSNDQGKSSNDM